MDLQMGVQPPPLLTVFNDTFILQLLILLLILFIIYSKTLFFLLLNSIFFLILLVTMSWGFDFDIFSSFLLIIDLGLFLVFFIISLNLTFLFKPQLLSFSKVSWFFIFIVLLVCYFCFSTSVLTITPFLISLINWYGLFGLVFLSELHILFECYFNLTSLEFFILNFYLYLTIFLIYYLIFIRYSFPLWDNKTRLKLLITKYIQNSLHIKWQNPLKQQNTYAFIKGWS